MEHLRGLRPGEEQPSQYAIHICHVAVPPGNGNSNVLNDSYVILGTDNGNQGYRVIDQVS